MRIEEIKISPAMAREWLAVEPDRPMRGLRSSTLSKIRHAIDSGEWRLTHQPIALDKNGFVLDGRHRLTVIAEQRKHVPSLVAFDADPETYTVIDTGATRSPGDTLRLAGYTDVNVLAAAARQTHAYPLVVGTADTLDSRSGRMTSAEILAIVASPDVGKAVQDAASPGTHLANAVGRYGWRSSAVVLVAVIGLYTEQGEATQHEFIESVANGANLPVDSPILAYRRWLMLESGFISMRHNYRRTASLANGIKAWNAWINGEERHNNSTRYREGNTLMPEVQ